MIGLNPYHLVQPLHRRVVLMPPEDLGKLILGRGGSNLSFFSSTTLILSDSSLRKVIETDTSLMSCGKPDGISRSKVTEMCDELFFVCFTLYPMKSFGIKHFGICS